MTATGEAEMRRTQGTFLFRNTKEKNQYSPLIHLHNLYSMHKKGVAAAKCSDVRAPPKEARQYWMHKRDVDAAERSDVRAPPRQAKHRNCPCGNLFG